jgi:hypothetical protein
MLAANEIREKAKENRDNYRKKMEQQYNSIHNIHEYVFIILIIIYLYYSFFV